ncbi:unnamed protein product, partial [Ectocarpus fasciculatus]
MYVEDTQHPTFGSCCRCAATQETQQQEQQEQQQHDSAAEQPPMRTILLTWGVKPTNARTDKTKPRVPPRSACGRTAPHSMLNSNMPGGPNPILHAAVRLSRISIVFSSLRYRIRG